MSRVEQLELADRDAVPAEMPPLQAGPHEDPEAGTADGAVGLGLLAGFLLVVVLERVEDGVAGGGEVQRQPDQARALVLRGERAEPVDPVPGPRAGERAPRRPA